MTAIIRHRVIVFFVIVLVAIVHLPILNGFFQHDEWQTFAAAYLTNYGGVTDVLKDSFLPQASHYSPLFDLTFNFLFFTFGINYLGYAIVSLVLHLFVVLLIFFLAYRLTNKLILACMSALLFGLNASSSQTTSWIIANINTHGATIFGLLSLIILIYLLREDKKKYWIFFVSLFFLIASLMFKEIAISFFVLLPITFLLFAKPQMKKYWKVYSFVVLGIGMIYLGFRVSMFVMPVSDSEFVVTKDQNFKEIVYNTLTFPAKIFAQSVIPTWQLLQVSKVISTSLPNSIAGQPGTTKFDQFVENVVLQLMDFSIFILAIIAVLFVWKSRIERSLKKVVLWSFTFTILSSFIYALSPGRSGSIPVIDSRNIYLPAVGTSILIATMVYIIARKRLIAAVFIFTMLIFLHIYWLNDALESRTSIGAVRKDILQQIKKDYPDLPEKVVFFVASDTAYYGMPEKIPPFETGLGQALLVWYHPTEKFPTGLFENRFLRFITDQGYREINGRGFGYFRDINLLEKALKQNNLLPESVISYNYFGGMNVLQDTTTQTREKLKNENKSVSY